MSLGKYIIGTQWYTSSELTGAGLLRRLLCSPCLLLCYHANGSNAKPMAPTCAESSELLCSPCLHGHHLCEDRVLDGPASGQFLPLEPFPPEAGVIPTLGALPPRGGSRALCSPCLLLCLHGHHLGDVRHANLPPECTGSRLRACKLQVTSLVTGQAMSLLPPPGWAPPEPRVT